MTHFGRRVREHQEAGLSCYGLDTLQVNIGRRCNLKCRHCHLECGPDRAEAMPPAIMEALLALLAREPFKRVDVTGGSPELHPRFREFVTALTATNVPVQVRTNLTALAEPGLADLFSCLAAAGVTLVASLPCYSRENVDAQRGPGTYERSVAALQRLNRHGFGTEAGPQLDLVYNPAGAFLPGAQAELEDAYHLELESRFGIRFSNLLVMTNMPLGRFRHELAAANDLDAYMELLRTAFNPATLGGLMCRHQICVDWDGALYDCDFNLALGLQLEHGWPQHLDEFDRKRLAVRAIRTGPHCFGCTAGSGSSCEGALV